MQKLYRLVKKWALTVTIHSCARLALFLLITKNKFDIDGFLNNFFFHQSRLESGVLQNMRVVEAILIIDAKRHITCKAEFRLFFFCAKKNWNYARTRCKCSF